MNGTLHAGRRPADLALVLPGQTMSADASQGDFDTLFLRHYPRIVDLIGRVVRDQAQAEHLAADVFWKLYRKAPDGRDGRLGGWLYRAALRAALDALKVASRRSRHETAAHAEYARTAAPGDPLEDLLALERQAQVRTVLARMKPKQARLLLLRASGLSYQEVADALGLNARSIGTQLARAEASFDRHYRELHGDRG